MAAAAVELEVVSLSQLEALVGEVGGPHLPQINLVVVSVDFGDADAMAVIMDHLSANYAWFVGNSDRLRDLATLYTNVNRVAEVILPRLRSDVRDAQPVALQGAAPSSSTAPGRSGALPCASSSTSAIKSIDSQTRSVIHTVRLGSSRVGSMPLRLTSTI
uniref:Uncharacterized protein n=1 Tax=Oryza meridionalis TaxID=40149 RepID=A0A0E0E8Q6_9ORYZ